MTNKRSDRSELDVALQSSAASRPPRELPMQPEQRVLRALFELAQLDCPASVGALAQSLGMGATEVARLLVALEQRGLVRAERSRLTMAGLVAAARLPTLALEVPVKKRHVSVRPLARGLAKVAPRAGLRRAHVLSRTGCH